MSDMETHLELYRKFKKDAQNPDLFKGTRVEAYFLSAFHLIEACAAKERIHIHKHQKVRLILEENEFLFGGDSDTLWRLFQILENQLRPKFTYAISWDASDFGQVIEHYQGIEEICSKVLKHV